MASEWAYLIARDQRRDVETMATNLDAARAQGRREGMEEAARVADDRRRVYAGSPHVGDRLADHICSLIAAEIRARIEEEPTKPKSVGWRYEEILAYLRYKQSCEGRRAVKATYYGDICQMYIERAQLIAGVIDFIEMHVLQEPTA